MFWPFGSSSSQESKENDGKKKPAAVKKGERIFWPFGSSSSAESNAKQGKKPAANKNERIFWPFGSSSSEDSKAQGVKKPAAEKRDEEKKFWPFDDDLTKKEVKDLQMLLLEELKEKIEEKKGESDVSKQDKIMSKTC